MNKEWLMSQLIAFYLQQRDSEENLCGKYADIIMEQVNKEKK